MMFRLPFGAHERFHQNPGSGEKQLYAPRFTEDGALELVEDGKEDFYGYIQSFAESVDIHKILERFQAGETDALSQVQGTYGDFTSMPKTYAELLNRVIDGRQWFDELPVEIRANFNHSFTEFMASMDDPDFLQRMGMQPEAPPDSQPELSPDPKPSTEVEK